MAALELKGRPASDGIYCGPAVYLDKALPTRTSTGTPQGEKAALDAAIAEAIAGVSLLMERSEGEAADILAFQVAMLEDDALQLPACERIDRGAAADAAWTAALDDEIAGYQESDDEYFRARAADLTDIRDRVLRHLSGAGNTQAVAGAVLLAEDIAPTLFLETDWSQGGAIALSGGSASSHVAMLARARGVPMTVGLGPISAFATGDVIVDGGQGVLTIDPDDAQRAAYVRRQSVLSEQRVIESRYLFEPAQLKDGSPVQILINVAGVEELDHIDPRCCDGIGLMRSEFLFRDGSPLPDEDQQYSAYRRFIEWAEGRPVTIRTLDIGGDKPVRGLTPEGESNPFLGLRGVRLTLARPDVFATQLRALARAAVHGPLKVMLPMVTVPDEVENTRQLLANCIADLEREHIACATPPLGIMIEVPAAAIAPELFSTAAFFSIGSNDLTQYVTASSRDGAAVAALNDSGHPAIARLIGGVTAFGRANGIPVSLCGDMASETTHLNVLIAAGLRSLSVAPSRVARIKAALAEL